MKVIEVSRKAFEFYVFGKPPLNFISSYVGEDYYSYLNRTFNSQFYPLTKPDKHLLIFLDKDVYDCFLKNCLQTNENVMVSDLDGLVNTLKISNENVKSWLNIRDAIIRDFKSRIKLKVYTRAEIEQELKRLQEKLRQAEEDFDKNKPAEDVAIILGRVLEGGVDLLYRVKTGFHSSKRRFHDKLRELRPILDKEIGPFLYDCILSDWKKRARAAHYQAKRIDRSVPESMIPTVHKFVMEHLPCLINTILIEERI